MNLDLQNKVVLITGAASGIGKATALAFASQSAQVVLSDINKEQLDAAVDETGKIDPRAIGILADAASPDGMNDVVAQIEAQFGRLDAAHNNVGVSDYGHGLLADKSTELWHKTIELTLSSTFYAMRAEIPLMLKNGGGAIVNTASAAGVVAFPGNAAYVAAKHGVIGITKAACLEYARDGIRCNAVAPGNIMTPPMRAALEISQGALDAVMASIPMGRLGAPEEIAQAVLWLCSPAAAYVNGPVCWSMAAMLSPESTALSVETKVLAISDCETGNDNTR